MKTDARLLRKALGDMRAALGLLIDPVVKTYETDTGCQTYTGPSLLGQLRMEVANSFNRGVARSRSTPIPINPDAYDLLVAITEWASATPRTLDDRLAAMVAEAGRGTDVAMMRAIGGGLTDWANAIAALLNPLRGLHIAKPCPRCNTMMAWRETPNGERLQTHALVIDGTHGCECLACGAFWPLTHLEHLARVLGCDPLPGASEYVTTPA